MIAACLAALTATAGVQAAPRPDLGSLKQRAQAIADEVTALELQLAELRDERDELQEEMDALALDISRLEGSIHDYDLAFAAARDRLVARMVEAYKRGPSSDLDLLLSADSITEAASIAQSATRAAEIDARRLDELISARVRAQQAQEELADKKQRLVRARSKVDEVSSGIERDLGERKDRLAELNSAIAALQREAERAAARAERQAERAAARSTRQAERVAATAPGPSTHGPRPQPQAPETSRLLLEQLEGSGLAASIPPGFTSTGVSFEGEASWYGPGFEGNLTASGDVFDSSLYTAASLDLPLGTWLYVEHLGRGVVVLINDRGPYAGERVLDLSHAAARAIGITGVGWVEATVLIKK